MTDIGILSFGNLSLSSAIFLKYTEWLYLSYVASNQENKATLFSSTLKVKENKVLIFLI